MNKTQKTTIAKHWFSESVKLASQKNYLDQLQVVYPMTSPARRDINEEKYAELEKLIVDGQDNEAIIRKALEFEKSPIENPYMSIMRVDKSYIDRNPSTVRAIASDIKYLYQIGKLAENLSEPKKMNRQLGQCFRNWMLGGSLSLPNLSVDEFVSFKKPAILAATEKEMLVFATKLGYVRKKRLDLVMKSSGYIIGQSKFITNPGGNQNNQLDDAFAVFDDPCNAMKVAVLDGLPYTHKSFLKKVEERVNNGDFVFSSLVLNHWLAQVSTVCHAA